MARRPSSVRPSVCKLLRKSLLLAGKWPDRHQTFTRWTPGQRASRLCSRSRSKVMWYAHFLGFLEWATPSLTVWFFICVCIFVCVLVFYCVLCILFLLFILLPSVQIYYRNNTEYCVSTGNRINSHDIVMYQNNRIFETSYLAKGAR